MKTLKLFLIIGFGTFAAKAQTLVPDTVNKEPVTELQCVQTPANTFIATLMVTVNGYPATVIYRSTDNGTTWDSVYFYGADAIFNGTPDPQVTADSAGNLYMAVMRYQPIGGGFTAEMWVFKSLDDGLTWNMESTPYDGTDFADYPSITSLGNGLVYLSYTLYTPDTSFITFLRSLDGAATWQDTSTFATLPPPFPTYDAIGSDLGWSFNNKLCLSYGDYNYGVIYFASSNDSGATWTPLQNITIAPSATYIVTKVVSSKNYSHLGIIAHKPHTTTDVYYLWSTDTGNTWQYQTISNNSAYCEGEIDSAGNVHLIYNELTGGTSRLCYKYSLNQGQTFTPALTLLQWSATSLTAGEYQSLILGSDGLFHLTFVDWNNYGTGKHLVFAPLLASIYETNPLTHAPRIYPNPVNDYLFFQSDIANTGTTYDIINLAGESVLTGKINIPETKADVSVLKNGIYILRVNSGNTIYVQKIVKE